MVDLSGRRLYATNNTDIGIIITYAPTSATITAGKTNINFKGL